MQRHTAANVDVLALEVSRRLCALNDAALLDDPHSHVLRIAAEVETEWERRARRSWTGESVDAIPAPSASACNAIRAAVLALHPSQRQLLLLHLDGLSYRQIATSKNLPQETVLRGLVGAYCQLRGAMSEAQIEETRS
jgi:DNA-directed RNA polymerase specialized sigma24 family protein